MQALHLLALEPVVEMQVDKHAYGFRPMRSAADAIEQCFNVLAQKGSAQFILEGDIKACFDRINHEWLLKNVQIDKTILGKWLSCGYLEKQIFHPTEEGTPQGGVISPSLMNIALTGLTDAVEKAVSKKDKVHVISYADDFVITSASKEALEMKVKPAIVNFLKVRGLELSQEKTLITHIKDGFDFLGFNVRKYKGKLLIKPSKKGIKRFLFDIRSIIKSKKAITTHDLIGILNPKIRGWTNYYRHVVAKDIFQYIGCHIFKSVWRWAKRRHPKKSRKWVRKKYFRSERLRNWIFFARNPGKTEKKETTDLLDPASVKIKRHIKIRSAATPFDPQYSDYLNRRIRSRKSH